MPRVKMRFALPACSALAAVALTGCSDEPTPTTPSASNPAAAPATSAATVPSSAAAASPAAAASSCPVTAATLEKAFKANAVIADAIVLGKGFRDISCYAGWATAAAQPANLEAATVLFKYDTAKKTWAAISGGTDGVCRDRVPADIATHLKGCQN
jgi:hypothetical protein